MHQERQLIPRHGGYRKLKSFQLAQLIYDVTVRFCERYIKSNSRTRDQMTQAARSGVQNIAEGSQASGTSKKTELKLTNVARASLEELRLDYEDFLRQQGFSKWAPTHPALLRFKNRRCSTLEEVRNWAEEEREFCKGAKPASAELAANAALSLLNVACSLVDRQLSSLDKAFLEEGGFTERIYRLRTQQKRRRTDTDPPSLKLQRAGEHGRGCLNP